MISGQLSVRPVKIVAGHEPEKTNEFLQAIGTAILNKVRIFFGGWGVNSTQANQTRFYRSVSKALFLLIMRNFHTSWH